MKLRVKAGIIAVCGLAAAASATPLNYGTTVTPPTAAIPAGFSYENSISSPFSTTQGSFTINGTMVSSIWRNGSNQLLFVYQVQVGNGSDSIESFTVNGWNSTVNISAFGQTAGSPTGFLVSGNTAMAGDVQRLGAGATRLNMQQTNIAQNTSGFWIWFQTTETEWSYSAATVQNGVAQSGLQVFAPIIPLPPGSGMATAGLACLFGTGYLRRRRLRAN
jgi:hypothetical protein